MAGVAQQILWSIFSPLPAGDGGMIGVIPFVGQSQLVKAIYARRYFLPVITNCQVSFGLLSYSGDNVDT